MAQLVIFSNESGMPLFSLSSDTSSHIPFTTLSGIRTAKQFGKDTYGIHFVSISNEKFNCLTSSTELYTCILISQGEFHSDHIHLSNWMKILMNLLKTILPKSNIKDSNVKNVLRGENVHSGLKFMLQMLVNPSVSFFSDFYEYPNHYLHYGKREETESFLESLVEATGSIGASLMYDASILECEKMWRNLPSELILSITLLSQCENDSNCKIYTNSPINGKACLTLIAKNVGSNLRLMLIVPYSESNHRIEKDISTFIHKNCSILENISKACLEGFSFRKLVSPATLDGILLIDQKRKLSFSSLQRSRFCDIFAIGKKVKVLRKFINTYGRGGEEMSTANYLTDVEGNCYSLKIEDGYIILLFSSKTSLFEMKMASLHIRELINQGIFSI